jgi:hypothetical protein
VSLPNQTSCAVCDVSNLDCSFGLYRFACGHVLCPICQAVPCPVCAGEMPDEDEQTPLEQAIEDGEALLEGYGEMYDVPEAGRFAYEQLAMIVTCLRLWAEDAGYDTAQVWREAYLRSEAIKQARKVY